MKACIACLLLCLLAGAVTAEPISVPVSVRLRDKPGKMTDKALVGVGGFAMKRSDAAFAGASCPNMSNAKGELDCKVVCKADDTSLQLLMLPPTQEKARVVAGLAPPGAPVVEIVGCQLSSKLPVMIVYRTLEVALDDLSTSNPEVVQAATVAMRGGLGFKSFDDSAPKLQALSAKPSNRAAMADLARIAAAFRDAPPERRPALFDGAELSQYAVGLNSVLLRAHAADAGGSAAASKVKVSSDAADYQRSLASVQKTLDAKPYLNEKEIRLSSEVRMAKQSPKHHLDKLETMDRAVVQP